MYYIVLNKTIFTYRLRNVAVLLLLGLALSACGGGGGGNGQPNPQFPDTVEEIGDADLASAGLPDIGSLASISSRSSSMLNIPEENKLVINLSLGWDGVIASHNLVEAGDGAGWQVSAETGETKRMLAWAVYAIPATADAHLWNLEYEMSKSNPGLPVFYAVANQTQGSWEIGGRLAATQGGGGIFNDGGHLAFSQSQDYVMPNGNAYLAILVGHPGNGNYNSGICMFGQCFCTALLDSANENYPNEEYSMQWSPGSFSMITDGTSNTLVFDNGTPPAQNTRLLLGTDTQSQLAGVSQWTDHNESDPGIGFFDIHQANAARHSYELTTLRDGSTQHINHFPLVDANGNGQANGIIGVLIALQGPVPNVPVNIYIDDIIIGATSTDSRGRFDISGLQEGSYTLEIGDPDNPLMLRELEVSKFGKVLVGLLLPAIQ